MMVRRSMVVAMALLVAVAAWAQRPRWQTLPPTPTLPTPDRSGYAPVNGIRLWYAVFGQGDPVVFLHGGLANADYWGLQVPAVAEHHQVIVMDSRGHGRSTRDARPFGYDLMADDVVGLLDYLGVRQAAVVGWSDGGILGLDLAIRHPDRVSRVFAFAANTDPSGVVAGVEKNPTFAAFIARAGDEYAALSATPGEYHAFVDAIGRMWATQPNWTAAQLRAIRTPVLVADGDHDEAIKRPHTDPRCRAADLTRHEPLLISSGPRAVYLARAAFPGARAGPVTRNAAVPLLPAQIEHWPDRRRPADKLASKSRSAQTVLRSA